MAAAYWYTFEVGLCTDDGGQRAVLGGAILSSLEETKVAMASSKVVPFEIALITNEHYRTSIQYSGLQPYYVVSPTLTELCS